MFTGNAELQSTNEHLSLLFLAKEGYTVEKHPKFELYQDKAGEFRFRLKATNGEIIAASQGYSSKSGCQNGIDSVKRNAPEAEIVDETGSE